MDMDRHRTPDPHRPHQIGKEQKGWCEHAVCHIDVQHVGVRLDPRQFAGEIAQVGRPHGEFGQAAVGRKAIEPVGIRLRHEGSP